MLPGVVDDAALEADELDDIPDFFYKEPPPPPSPLLINLTEDLGRTNIWSEGTTTPESCRYHRRNP